MPLLVSDLLSLHGSPERGEAGAHMVGALLQGVRLGVARQRRALLQLPLERLPHPHQLGQERARLVHLLPSLGEGSVLAFLSRRWMALTTGPSFTSGGRSRVSAVRSSPRARASSPWAARLR